MDEIQVLNGTVKVGDRVAVAIGSGRHGSGMRVGEVLEVTIVPRSDGSQSNLCEVKLRVERSSGYHFQKLPYIKAFGNPKRMVKLGALQDAL